ncbi:HAD family hydrolase [Leptolyngbya sp. FACHB-261]|uniref:HAD family hydrolase n=1 Tax=Leptolyngbya sp. FACHB-261 TaxID=2692806 RepID=UPI0016879321|nr:HAD family hydrolase [Leptolyngbya sp. FACHB-261]MBD2103317.1 HAD family phosphatase [Leptolyngbya sp. FACHB-261]
MTSDAFLSLPDSLVGIRLIATDMDGTLTTNGHFSAPVLRSLSALAASGLPVLLVTGRSAGWVAGLRAYLPGLVGAIAENGGVGFRPDPDSPEQLLIPLRDVEAHRQQLRATFDKLRASFPSLEAAADNRFRLTDWTFANRNLSFADLQQLRELCGAQGWAFTYSTVQCHIYSIGQDKGSAVSQVLKSWFPGLGAEQVLTVGDSPNDESLFNPALFPVSVGVAGLQDYAEQMTYRPRYLTDASEGEGFCELAALLLKTPPSEPLSGIQY